MNRRQIGDDILVIEDFLSDEECVHHIRFSEDKGYAVASVQTETGTKVIPGVRNNERLIWDDMELADLFWNRLESSAPSQIGNSKSSCLNERFRYYKYRPGQRFKRHIDESYIRNELEASYYTFMIYLNDDFEGGETVFDNYKIKSRKGMALIFLHILPHEGTEVTAGVKYVLRSDIMFKLKEPEY